MKPTTTISTSSSVIAVTLGDESEILIPESAYWEVLSNVASNHPELESDQDLIRSHTDFESEVRQISESFCAPQCA